jgi:hypothetical protein
MAGSKLLRIWIHTTFISSLQMIHKTGEYWANLAANPSHLGEAKCITQEKF